MTAQLKTLTELVQQLQVENAQLGSEASQSLSSVHMGVLPISEQQPHSVGTGVMGGSTTPSPVGARNVMFMYHENASVLDFLGEYPKTQ